MTDAPVFPSSSGIAELATKLEARARKFLAEMNGVVTDTNAAGYEVIDADVVGGYWKEDANIDLQAAEALRGVAQAVPQRDEMVARALARIAANFSDPETDDLTIPLAIELAEVQARLSYMEGKYGAIDWNTAVSSTEREGK